MFTNEFKRELREHGWDYIQSKDSNPSQFWRRKRNLVTDTIGEITLFLGALPEEKRDEILSYQNIRPLINLITKIYKPGELPNLHLLLEILSDCLDIIKNIHSNKNEDSPNLSKITVDHLNQTTALCSDIVHIALNEYAIMEGSKKDWKYICKANKTHIIDDNRFYNFIRKVLIHDLNVELVTFGDGKIKLQKYARFSNFEKSIYDAVGSVEGDYYNDPKSKIGELFFNMDPFLDKAHIKIVIGDSLTEVDLEVMTKQQLLYFYASKKVANKYNL
jgi:hypothetical protein